MTNGLPSELQEELLQLIDSMLDQELSLAQSQRLNEILQGSKAVEFYARYTDLHGELAWRRRGAELASVIRKQSTTFAPVHTAETIEPAPRRLGIPVPRNYTTYVSAACVLLLAGVAVFFATRDGKDDFRTDGVSQSENSRGWIVVPTGLAQFRFAEPHVIELERGELYIESTDHDTKPLTIKTPFGETIAENTTVNGDPDSGSTSAYVGTHFPQENGPMIKPLTRVLILSGIVSLSNSLGVIDGTTNGLLYAEERTPPRNVAVEANNEFAISLYQTLGGVSDENQNILFSPYSIANALSMLAEGARGQTADELGKALGFPEELRRVGDDAQLIPWRVAQIHTGFADINARLQRRSNDPKTVKTRERIKELTVRMEATREKYLKSRKWRDVGDGPKLAAEINMLSRQLADYDIEIANALWADHDFPIRDSYAQTINRFYNTGGVYSVDFENDFEAVRRQMSDWCTKHTKGKLSFDLGSVPPSVRDNLRLLITNAVYFRAGWEVPFENRSTKPKAFTLSSGEEVLVDMMHGNRLTRYAAFEADASAFDTPQVIVRGQKNGLYPENGFHVLELGYRGGDLSMVVITSTEASGGANLNDLLLSNRLSSMIDNAKKRMVKVRLPKFKLQTDYQLEHTLAAMGITSAFQPSNSAGGADFSGLFDDTSGTNDLFLQSVLHKSIIEVNEQGTEAVSFTLLAKTDSEQSSRDKVPFTPTFNADRPFVFVIRDTKTGTILFIGRMNRPSKAGITEV